MRGADAPFPFEHLEPTLAEQGFAFVEGGQMRPQLEQLGPLADWQEFAASWNDLVVDSYLAEHGRFRRRRHAVYRVPRRGSASRLDHQPHYQSLHYNPLQGGIERWFEPIDVRVGAGETLQRIFQFMRDTFGPLAPATATWRAEVHQFRIESRAEEPGQPTPEGVHRDGVDFVLVLLVRRENIVSGTTTVYEADGRLLGEFTLAKPFDSALLVDERVFHGVTPVHPMDPALPAYRDVLVVTFKGA